MEQDMKRALRQITDNQTLIHKDNKKVQSIKSEQLEKIVNRLGFIVLAIIVFQLVSCVALIII